MTFVSLDPSQEEWVRMRSEALDIPKSRFIRYVLDRWMQAERAFLNDEDQTSFAQPTDVIANMFAAAADAPDETPAAPEHTKIPRSEGDTLIHTLRRSVQNMERIQGCSSEPKHDSSFSFPEEDPMMSSSDEPDEVDSPESSESPSEDFPDESDGPDDHDGTSLRHAAAVQSLFEIAKRAQV